MSSYVKQQEILRENFGNYKKDNIMILSNGAECITGSTLLGMFKLFYDVSYVVDPNGDMSLYMMVKQVHSDLGFSNKFSVTIPAVDMAWLDIEDKKELEHAQIITALLQFPESQFMEELYLTSMKND